VDLIIIAIFAGLALLGAAAQVWGVDSRPEFFDPRLPGNSTSI
jgi:hypothetical protein